MSESLFDLVGEYKELYAMLTDADEEDQQIVEDSLESVVGAIEAKGEGYIAILNRLDMEIDACRKQKDMWMQKLSIRENAVKRLKQRLADAMIQLGKNEIQAGDNTIKLQNNGGKAPLVFDEDKKIPQSYMKVILEPDKDKIRADLEKGEILDFAYIGDRGKHIKIK